MAEKLLVRGFKLASILSKPHGHTELILRCMDLEDEVEELRGRKPLPGDAWPEICFDKSIQIDEWADEAGYLRNPPDEETWVESLTCKTALDVRAVVGELPKENGLYHLRIVYKVGKDIRQGTLKVWVVKLPD